MKKPSSIKLNKKQLRFSAVVIIATVVTAVGFTLIKNDKASTPIYSNKVITEDVEIPDETPVTTNSFIWAGAGSEPKHIDLPTIDGEGYLQKMGVNKNKQIAVPSNIHLGGWFVDSVKPGEKGLSIIVGHVNGRVTDAGIFKNLGKLAPGDEFTVELGNGTKKTFEVKTVNTYKTEESASYLFSQDPSVASQLNLITCTGRFVASERSYDQRIIVTSALKD